MRWDFLQIASLSRRFLKLEATLISVKFGRQNRATPGSPEIDSLKMSIRKRIRSCFGAEWVSSWI